jgi:hypothetical protein
MAHVPVVVVPVVVPVVVVLVGVLVVVLVGLPWFPCRVWLPSRCPCCVLFCSVHSCMVHFACLSSRFCTVHFVFDRTTGENLHASHKAATTFPGEDVLIPKMRRVISMHNV